MMATGAFLHERIRKLVKPLFLIIDSLKQSKGLMAILAFNAGAFKSGCARHAFFLHVL